MPKLSWSQPTCEYCWIIQRGVWESDGDDSILVGVPTPTYVRAGGVERCAYCGGPTIVGIYVRDDPKNVPYPREESEDGGADEEVVRGGE